MASPADRLLFFERLEDRWVLAAGDLDPTFGGDGRVLTDFFTNPVVDEFNALAVGPGGTIVAVGSASDGTRFAPDFSVAKYDADGSLDGTFGTQGRVVTDSRSDVPSRDDAFAVSVLGDGSILVAGRTATRENIVRPVVTNPEPLFNLDFSSADSNLLKQLVFRSSSGGTTSVVRPHDFALVKYSPDGTLDPSFGSAGVVLTDFGDQTEDSAFAMLVQANGAILLAGSSDGDVALARYDADGTLDATFGTGGLVTSDLGGAEQIAAAALQTDGKILVAGSTEGDMLIARYNADGTLDTTFDGDGFVLVDYAHFPDRVTGLAVQPDGKIVAAGQATVLAAGGHGDGDIGLLSNGVERGKGIAIASDGGLVVAGYYESFNAKDSLLLKVTPAGVLDTSFDDNGIALTPFFDNSDSPLHLSVIQDDDKVIAIGRTTGGYKGSDILLTRYNTDGSQDATFGADSRVILDFMRQDERPVDAVLQPDGRLLLAYRASLISVANETWHIARFNPDGTLDAAFGTDGQVQTDAGIDNLFLLPDGKIVTLFELDFDNTDNVPGELVLSRLNADGSVDTTFGTNGSATWRPVPRSIQSRRVAGQQLYVRWYARRCRAVPVHL